MGSYVLTKDDVESFSQKELSPIDISDDSESEKKKKKKPAAKKAPAKNGKVSQTHLTSLHKFALNMGIHSWVTLHRSKLVE